jgi:hypothetical protein
MLSAKRLRFIGVSHFVTQNGAPQPAKLDAESRVLTVPLVRRDLAETVRGIAQNFTGELKTGRNLPRGVRVATGETVRV